MPPRPGQKPGQKPGRTRASDLPPAGWGWREYLAALIEAQGSLAAIAWKLIELSERGDGPDDVASVERALRRLRERGQRDGGVWGQRLLRRFGVPRSIEDRLRWMGLYHSPFNDLPLGLCEDQLRLWDQPPISASRARVWLQLAATSVALRRRAFDKARAALDGAVATLAVRGPDEARPAEASIEAALARAYLESRIGTEQAVTALLQQAERALAETPLDRGDRACFVARLIDQRAFRLNVRGEHAAALALYQTLPSDDVHPFASYRREAGLAFGCLRTGLLPEARRHALLACEHAGDGGYTRLRVMSLLMLARLEEAPAAAQTLARAAGIAGRLGDDELQLRVTRAAAGRAGG